MVSSLRMVVALIFFVSGVSLQASEKYVPDKAHSNIGFTVRHMVITTVPGKFSDYDVTFMFNESDLANSHVKAVIKTATIDTDNQKRDEHLRSPDFLDAQNYPHITFESNEIQKTDDGYVAKGTLTIRGISKEIEMPFKMLGPINDPWGNQKIGVEASLDINRFDYNVKWDKTLDTGSLVVSDEVKVKLDLQLVKES